MKSTPLIEGEFCQLSIVICFFSGLTGEFPDLGIYARFNCWLLENRLWYKTRAAWPKKGIFAGFKALQRYL